MKKSLSVISSLLFAALCLGFAFNAYAQDVTVLNEANTVISISEQNYVYDGTPKKPTVSVYYNGSPRIGQSFFVCRRHFLNAAFAFPRSGG